jgi:protein-tyrosine phosphatase
MATNKKENERGRDWGRWTTVQVALDGGGLAFDPEAVVGRWDAGLVEPGLYIGSLSAALNRPALDSAGITHILSVMYDWRRILLEEKQIDDDKFKRKFVPVEDNARMAKELAEAFHKGYEWIRDALATGGRVLVHCQAGISRSSTMVCSYLMQKYCTSMDDGLERIRRVRPIVMPNSGFLLQLRQLQRSIYMQVAKQVSIVLRHTTCPVNIVLDFLHIDVRNLEGNIIPIRDGDRFACKRWQLPSHLSVTSENQMDNRCFKLEPLWGATTLVIDSKVGSWCILRIDGLGNSWFLLHESTLFDYTIYTIPHLIGNQPSADEDHANIILPNFTLHYICLNAP